MFIIERTEVLLVYKYIDQIRREELELQGGYPGGCESVDYNSGRVDTLVEVMRILEEMLGKAKYVGEVRYV